MKAKVKLSILIIAMSNILFACAKEETENGQVPVIETIPISVVTHYTALSGGKILSEESSSITARGLCWSDMNQTPEISDNNVTSPETTQTFSDYIKCLNPNTTYYVRAFATNNSGTGYGNVLTFTTLSEQDGTTSDVEGNIYQTVQIGSQIWFAENLRTTKYNNGESIATKTGEVESESTPKYQWPANNDLNNVNSYGRLYTWFAATDSRNVCPCGWHVPDNDEWAELTDFLGGEDIAGGKLKEAGTTHWLENNGATNSSGFTALPAGIRDYNANYAWFGLATSFWSSSDNGDEDTFANSLGYESAQITTDTYSKKAGYSIRCIKD